MSVSRTPLRLAGVCAAGLLIASTITSASAVTPPPMSSATIKFNQNISNNPTPTNPAASCTSTPTSSAPADATVAPNTPATLVNTMTGTVSDGTTTSTVTVSQNTKIAMTQTATAPTAIKASFTGTARSSAALHGCEAGGSVSFTSSPGVTVTLTKPTLVKAYAAVSNNALAVIDIVEQNSNSTQIVAAFTAGNHASGSGQAFLAPGTYTAQIESGVVMAPTAGTATQYTSGSMSMTFTPAGARLSGPSGAARPYVAMGAARACSTHTLTSKVGGAFYASKIQRVVILANGRVVKKAYRPAARASLVVRLPDSQTETVVVNVVLRNGKKLSERASYLYCS